MEEPPVLIVSGEEGFLRRRFLKELIETQQKAGWSIEHVDGKYASGLESTLSGGVLMGEQNLIVISNPEKLEVELVESHYEAGDCTYVLLLHCDGDFDSRTKFGKWVKKLDKHHRKFNLPKPWDAPEVAADFCVAEVRRFGKTMAKRVAQGLVAVAGPDLGMLHYELMKASMLADALGAEEITTDHIKGSLAPLLEADVQPVLTALGDRNLNKTLRALERVKATSRTDPTMMVCRIFGASVLKWLGAANLDARGVDPKEAAASLGVNSVWFYQNKILPPAVAWKQAGLVRLIHALAVSERALLGGHVDPWTGLVARIALAWEPLRK